MKSLITNIAMAVLCSPLWAQDKTSEKNDQPQGDKWKKELKDRSNRGTLHDAFQRVRGDSGRWNDDPKLQHTPPPGKTPLDDWYDRMERTRRRPLTPADDNWLLFKTKQLDDNDRVWVERIERNGNQFTVTLSQAIWQGRYRKTFTYYSVFGVNLGKLPPGEYKAKWIIKPLVFKQFEGNGRPLNEQRKENWSKDEQPAKSKPIEMPVRFSISNGT